MILFQFLSGQHLITFDFFMTCSNFKPLTSNLEYESWTWGQWDLKIVQSEQPDGEQPTTELFAGESGSSCGQTTLIFQNLKKRRRNTAQNEGVWKTGDPMEDWEQSQLSAINFHFLHQLWRCFSQAKHKSATLEPYNWKKTQNIYLLHSEKITSLLGSYTGKVNDNLQWSRTPWVTATILFWGGRGIKLQQM